MHNKRRPNNMNGGGQNRHNNNRPRRFGGGGGNHRQGDDSANVQRTRRNATQSREKYQNMARDALSMGDRVLAEYYLQHADHYYRILLALPPEEVRQPFQHRNPNQNNDGAENNEPHVAENSAQENHDGGAHTSSLPSFITQPIAQETNTSENLQD